MKETAERESRRGEERTLNTVRSAVCSERCVCSQVARPIIGETDGVNQPG